MTILNTLFDKDRRNKLQEALRRGDADALLRRQKPASEPHASSLLGKEQALPLGMAVRIQGSSFRFMGTEDECAIVRQERTSDGTGGNIRLKAGMKKAVIVETETGFRSHENYFLHVEEVRDPSGQMMMTATIVQEPEGAT